MRHRICNASFLLAFGRYSCLLVCACHLLVGCSLDASDKQKCVVSNDCLKGYVCSKTSQCVKSDELTPSACKDNIDNDGDGLTDFPSDPGCSAPEDEDEVNLPPEVCGTHVLVQPLPESGAGVGQLDGQPSSELMSATCGGAGEEHVYVYETQSPQSLTATTVFSDTSVDTVVYVRGDCRDPQTELGCNDDDETGASTVHIPRIEPGTYYIVVDSRSATKAGSYRLLVTAETLEGGECDPDKPDCASGLLCRLANDAAPVTTCEKPRCSDGIDNDGDGHTDFPNDPGCETIGDNDEADSCPDGPDCPTCSNGLDDDGDSFIDYGQDPDCESASSNGESGECISGVPLLPLDGEGATGTTSGYPGNFADCRGGTGNPEDVYAFSLERELTSLTFSTVGSSFNTNLYVRRGDCGDPDAELPWPSDCQNDDPFGEELHIESPALGKYFVFVDGNSSGFDTKINSGDYVLNVKGIIPSGGSCIPNEPGYECESGYACKQNTCTRTECSDGKNNDDGDNLADFPNDPGCESPEDDDETDDCPSGPNCPACSNDVDDDGDELTDFPQDPGCHSAADNLELDECSPGNPIFELTDRGIANGTTDSSQVSPAGPSCSVFPSLSRTGEKTYAYFNTRNLSSLSFSSVGAQNDTILAVRHGDCSKPDNEVACADNYGGGETVTVADPAANSFYYLIVSDKMGIVVPHDVAVYGTLRLGESCNAHDTQFVCDTASGGICLQGICTQSQCSDGIDNDNDGTTDAFDPGCARALDNNESDDPVETPKCADGLDNDGDGKTDYPLDNSCERAAQDQETAHCSAESDGIRHFDNSLVMGYNEFATNDYSPSCRNTSMDSKEQVYEIYFPGKLNHLRLETHTNEYTWEYMQYLVPILYVRPGDCSAPDLACDSGSGLARQAKIELTDVPAGSYYVFVDGWDADPKPWETWKKDGVYTLSIEGEIASGQACDEQQIGTGILTCAPGTTCRDAICQ